MASRKQKSGRKRQLHIDDPNAWEPLTPEQGKDMVNTQFFGEGTEIPEIRANLERLGVKSLYDNFLRSVTKDARKKGWVRYEVPRWEKLSIQIKEKYSFLANRDIWVVRPALAEAVAHQGALMLCREMSRRTYGPEVRVGFVGGRTPSLMVRALSRILAKEIDAENEVDYNLLPSLIHFHSLTGNINNNDPITDPTSYFLYLAAKAKQISDESHLEMILSSLPAPGLVLESHRKTLGSLTQVKAAIDRIGKLDIAITSCGHFGYDHFALCDYIASSCRDGGDLADQWKATYERLSALSGEEQVVGDIAWNYINRKGRQVQPTDSDLSVMTMLDLAALERLATVKGRDRPTSVILLVAPCGGPACNKDGKGQDGSKGELLSCILGRTKPLLTHLVVDYLSAKELLGAR